LTYLFFLSTHSFSTIIHFSLGQDPPSSENNFGVYIFPDNAQPQTEHDATVTTPNSLIDLNSQESQISILFTVWIKCNTPRFKNFFYFSHLIYLFLFIYIKYNCTIKIKYI